MYLDAYKAQLLLQTESEEDSILWNKNVESRQTTGGVKVPKKVGYMEKLLYRKT